MYSVQMCIHISVWFIFGTFVIALTRRLLTPTKLPLVDSVDQDETSQNVQPDLENTLSYTTSPRNTVERREICVSTINKKACFDYLISKG